MADKERNPADVPLLDDVAEASERLRALEREQRKARDALRDELAKKVRAARDEGISFAAIARAGDFSREWARRLYSGEYSDK